MITARYGGYEYAIDYGGDWDGIVGGEDYGEVGCSVVVVVEDVVVEEERCV